MTLTLGDDGGQSEKLLHDSMTIRSGIVSRGVFRQRGLARATAI